MKVIDGLDAIHSPLDRSVLTIGNFDGVHRAHQQLLAQGGLLATDAGAPVVVLTFEPHPLKIVAPDRAPERLAPLDERLRLLEAAGADIAVIARSEPALLKLEADRFVKDVVIDLFHPTHIVEGPSFGFGRGRKGTPELLRELAAPHGCNVHILDPVTLEVDDGETLMVSSSLIRKLLSDGQVRKAGLCLGRPYALFGEIIEGDRRGRTLGFPTANLSVDDQLIPGDGVYAGRAYAGGDSHVAAISIGSAPTFEDAPRRVEAHLLDFDGDLYTKPMRLEFVRKIRDQRAFDSPVALTEQLHRDVQSVRELVTPERRGAGERS